MKTLLLILRTKLFLLGLLSTCTFILANNYIHRNDPFRFTEVKEDFVSKPGNSAIAKKKVAKQKMNLQLQANSFRDADASFTATVTSDKPDYAPLSTAIFTGAGFAPNEDVVLKVKNLTQPCHTVSADSSYFPWTVTADENGGFVTPWTVCDCAGDSLRLKATGQTSGSIAYVYFSDGNFSFTAAGLPAATSITVNYTIAGGGGGNGTFTTPSFIPPAASSDGGSNKTVTVNNYTPNPTTISGIKYSILNYTRARTVTAGGGSTTTTTNTTDFFDSESGNVTNVFTANYGALVVNSIPGECSGTASLSATFYSNYQTPSVITGKTISFEIDGNSVGSAATNGSGVATVAGVNISGYGLGGHIITASFEGETGNYFAIDGTGTLTIGDNTAPSLPLITTATGECSATVTAPTATDNCVGEVPGTTADPLSYSEQGTFTIHWSFNDGNGNISTANQTVIVDDVTAPSLPLITIATGECSATVAAPTATDNCVGDVLGTTADPLSYSEQGTFTIHWSFNDGNGNISTANQTVIVDDVTAPSLPVITTATGECSATVTAPTATDNCVGEVPGTTADPLSYSEQGTFTIHWSFNDGNGNVSTANQTVIVDDVTAPSLPLLTTATGECSATATAPTATDNCVGEVLGTTADPLSYSEQGTFTIHWSFNDGNGNISTANQTVIVDDVTAPSLPLITTATGECSATVTVPTATDNCAGDVLGTTVDPLTYSSQGTFTIHWSFNDGNGNISTANQTVIVDDVTAPSLPLITTATGECSATVTAPTATDNCVGDVLGTTADPLSYSEQGTFTIHWSFNDGNGNISTANQTVIVDDVTAPALPLITAATGECSATVAAPTATDNCVGEVPGTTADPLIYSEQGTFTIHWSFNDGNGNISTANQTVIVDDVTAPALPLITAATGECSATVTAPTATDNCVGEVPGTTADPLNYSSQGTFTIHWSFNDGNGNISTANQTVIVDDVTAPSLPLLTTATGECSATVAAPTATDNCAGPILGTTADPLTYSEQGTFTIHWSFNDGNGNISTASQTVVVDDVTAPSLPLITTATGECSATVTAPTATDNCVGDVLGTTADPLSYSEQGTFTIHWSFNDGNGNISTANQTVIVDDVTPPAINCIAPISVNNSPGTCGAVVNYSTPVGTDNCSGSVTTQTTGFASGSTFPAGVTTNTFKVTDAGGNTATCSFTVTVSDTEKPTISCPSNIVLSACTSTATWSTPSASDNCGTPSVEQTAGPAAGSTFANGSTTVIAYTATDAAGNTATCSFTVTRAITLTAACSNTNPTLYFGYTGDQTSTIKVYPSGGTGPYTVAITMNRVLNCNVVNNAGDEAWTGVGGSTVNNNCPSSGPGLTPVSTGTGIAAGGFYSVNVTLMQDATFTATITDANGCTTTCSTTVHAEDARCFNGNSGVAKVTICHKTGSATNPCVKICVDESAVASHLAHGDFLGNCTPNCLAPVYTTGLGTINNNAMAEVSIDEGFQVKAFPNPTEHHFTVSIKSNSNEKVSVVVFDALGRQVKKIEKGDAMSPVQFGEDLKTGIYIIEVRQGGNRKTIKLLKQ